jgi:hypothetical protein
MKSFFGVILSAFFFVGCGGGVTHVDQLSGQNGLTILTCYDGSTRLCNPGDQVTCNDGAQVTCPEFKVYSLAWQGSCRFSESSQQFQKTQQTCFEVSADSSIEVGCANLGGTHSADPCPAVIGDGRCEYLYYDNLKQQNKKHSVYYRGQDLINPSSAAASQKLMCMQNFDPIPKTQTKWFGFDGQSWTQLNK